MNKEKLARRKAAGDDPTAISKSNSTFAGSISPQPMPGMPQGPGNMMGDPRNVSSMYGGESPRSAFDPNNKQSPYGDGVFGSEVQNQKLTGNIEIVGSSKFNQNQVKGPDTGLNNIPLGMVSSPVDENARMMQPYYLAQAAVSRAEQLYGKGEMPSFQVGHLGMMGTPVEVGRPNRGQYPGTLTQQSANYLGLTGTPDVQAGMDTKTGGRNKDKGVA